ncbi:MAG: hypothetical protein EOO75_00285 [Myxococcales bacterium]|nr:MAG: hypothetical protein EOO75_00285 [Myxococcales bacterium]
MHGQPSTPAGQEGFRARARRPPLREESESARQLFTRYHWPVIDVTGRAIEETAVILLETMRERDERVRAARASLV